MVAPISQKQSPRICGKTVGMLGDQKAKLIARINSKCWWHVTPSEGRQAYEDRGRFYSSTFGESETYGRACNVPDRVAVLNPLIGDEDETSRVLLGHGCPDLKGYDAVCAYEAERKRRAIGMGFDSIVVPTRLGMRRFIETGRLPLIMELCLLDLGRSRKAHPRDFMVGWKKDLEFVNRFYTEAGANFSSTTVVGT